MPFDYDFSPRLKRIVQKLVRKDSKRSDILYKKIKQIINSTEDEIGHYKNLRYDLSYEKRVHIDKSFVLTFRFDKNRKFILFLDFGHHDNVYKK
ncbi:MAG: addiction module toxin RelE [Candidatus Diapherotrites archaeon]|nr:addiction module toxin RelE [Candidatus Diapherotrites archaeon]